MSPSASACLIRTSIWRSECWDSNSANRSASSSAAGSSAARLNCAGNQTRRLDVRGSTGAVPVGGGGGVDVACAVRVGTGEGGVREARSGPSEAHPALNMNPRETANRRIRGIMTDQSVCAKQQPTA